jgi:hypothetical protein
MRNAVSQPRRVRVERGIYRRKSNGATTYEITFTDSEGRQRWQTIGGGLRNARRARAEVVAKLGRGERVLRSRETVAEYAERWLETLTSQLRPRTVLSYRTHFRLHINPRLGSVRLSDLMKTTSRA